MGKLVEKLSWYSAFMYLFGAIVGFADPITDILTLVIYYREDHKTWFGVGLAFVILPCLIYPFCYLASHWSNHVQLKEASLVRCALYVLVYGINPFSVALARLRCFIFCLRNFKKIRKDEKDEFDGDTDNLLGHGESVVIAEALLESIPQFIIQLYVMVVQHEQVKIIQMISLPVSLLSLAWASANADTWLHSLIDIKETKHKVTAFVTHLFLLSSRLFAIGLFTVTFKWWIIGVLLLHSSLVVTFHTFWSCRRERCSLNNEDSCFDEALYSILIFCVHWVRDDLSISLRDDSIIKKTKQSWKTQLFSNLLFIVENIAMIVSFYFVSKFSNTWYSLPLTVCVCLFSVIGSAGRLTHFHFLDKEIILVLQKGDQF